MPPDTILNAPDGGKKRSLCLLFNENQYQKNSDKSEFVE